LNTSQPTFATVYAEHAGYVYNLARRMADSQADADDVYQEVFLRVHKFLPGYRGDGLRAWLRRITVNVFCTMMRKRNRERPGEQVGENLTSSAEEPGRMLEEKELGPRLAEALEQLSPEMRAAMVLRGVEDLSYQEISELLDVPIGTVRSRLARARVQLLHHLEGASS
jgi:RNA polymerase sigma-70 factor (ECF subfamily)